MEIKNKKFWYLVCVFLLLSYSIGTALGFTQKIISFSSVMAEITSVTFGLCGALLYLYLLTFPE